MKRVYCIYILTIYCITVLVACGSVDSTNEMVQITTKTTPIMTVKELFHLSNKGENLQLNELSSYISYAVQKGAESELDVPIIYRNMEYELQIKYNTEDNQIQEALLVFVNSGKNIDIRKDSVEEFLNSNMDMKNYLTYVLPEALYDGAYDWNLGNLGGNVFQSDTLEEKGVENLNEDIPTEWLSLGGVESYYKVKYTYEDGVLTNISLPWNHSEFLSQPELIDGTEIQGILVSVSHDLITGEDIEKNVSEQQSLYWYVFFSKEDSDVSYALYLSQDYFSKEDMIKLAKTVKFTDTAFSIVVD